MNLTITVQAEHASDELRSLDQELAEANELRGRVRPVAGLAKASELGVIDSALVVALGQGGAVTVLVTAVITWLRRRVGNVSVKVAGPDTTIELNAENVRGLTADQIQVLIAEMRDVLPAGSDAGSAT
ncbi:effector-associated constant component EACC1 [Amycolatopsis sp. EV170708-02-1]|uniref:effector-associated constant component EACC1 n=1 Tax=Amycolatopsis sp. EV170708-02-1 TaxID=2919322 RepID=UPI001F0BA6AC|nr:hypothetical protein [Amycolatopsis sp. EV170708-02-1]UMP06762.1 hypothetical protein MJQ72_18990 [Amycolatopsis sp. EV170708-02-1]